MFLAAPKNVSFLSCQLQKKTPILVQLEKFFGSSYFVVTLVFTSQEQLLLSESR